jgi:hypothetical protein
MRDLFLRMREERMPLPGDELSVRLRQARSWPLIVYSCRKADMGSILVARRAGIQQAIPAVTATRPAASQM